MIVKLSRRDRINLHFPDWLFKLCDKYDVFIEDKQSGKLHQVIDLQEKEAQDELENQNQLGRV